MSSRKIILPVVGISLIGAGAYLAYLYVNREREDDEDAPIFAKQKTCKMEVPSDAVGAIVGRGGRVIKELSEKSGCRMNFEDAKPDSQTRILMIRGQPDNCEMAKLLITEILELQSLIANEEITIPGSACGRIIGRCGENIQKICRSSNAKVEVNPKSDSEERTVRIRGTPEQRELAKSLIQELVDEDAEIRKNLAMRQPRGPVKSPSPVKEVQAKVKPTREKFIDKGHVDGQIEVYVSAAEDPSKFWVQIVGPKATELDQLVHQMTEYYNVDENKPLHKLDSVEVGDLVAAQFEFDQKWYRAEVSKVNEDQLELYFVDYGDTAKVKKNNVFELRTDYLLLRFQAIECYLASVEPVGEKWSDDAIGTFDELTHIAQWKKLWSKVVQYKERESHRGRREGSPVPGVHLFDNSDAVEVNIGEEMIKRGFAKSDSGPSTTQSPIATPIQTESPKVIDISSDEEELTENSIKVLSPSSTPRGESPRLVVTDTDSVSVDITSPDSSSFDFQFSTPMDKTLNNNTALVETNGNDSTTEFLDNERGGGDGSTPAKKQLFDANKF